MRAPAPRAVAGLMIVAGMLLAGGSVASTAQTGDDDPVRARAFRVDFRPLGEAFEVVSSILSADGQITLQPAFKTLLVQDHVSVLDRIGPLLESFDLPPRNVDVTLSLFLGTNPREDEAGQHLPPHRLSREDRGVAETLADFTKWTAYEPLGSRALAGTEGSTLTANLSDEYRVVLEIDSVRDKVVKFRSVTLQRVLPAEDGPGLQEVYKAEVAVRAGQALLVGAAKAPNSRRALFLTLQVTPR